MLGGSGPCNRNGVPLSDRNGKKIARLEADDDDWLALANAVMMSICSSYKSRRPWPRFCADAKRVMRVQDLTMAENMSRLIQSTI